MAHFHSHNHTEHSVNTPVRILYICLAINLIFVATEAFVGWKSNSTGLLSDAGHNLSDALGLLLSLAAIYLNRSGNKTNQKHDFKLYCPNPDAQELDLYLVHIGDDDKDNSGKMISSHRISFDITPLRSNEPRKVALHWVDITGTKRVHYGNYNSWPY